MVSQPSHMISVCFTTPSFRLPVLSLDATTQGKSSLSSTDEGRCLCSHFITLWHFYILYYSCLHTCLNLWIDCKGQGPICSDFLLSCILGLLWHQTASRNQNPFQLFLKKKKTSNLSGICFIYEQSFLPLPSVTSVFLCSKNTNRAILSVTWYFIRNSKIPINLNYFHSSDQLLG